MFALGDYDYDLPQKLIAQHPVSRRDRSKLLFLGRATGRVKDLAFHELCDILAPSDVLVINDTEVIPGRLRGYKQSGGKVEVLILDYATGCTNQSKEGEFVSDCLVKSSKPSRPGTQFFFDQDLEAEVINFQDGIYTLKFLYRGNFERLLYRIGSVPLPPYIKRDSDQEAKRYNDRKFYQTVYASQKGAIAAPTAGLHFSAELLDKLRAKGIKVVVITLHVGYGTFLPIRVSDIRHHRMHAEGYAISKRSADRINRAKAAGSRVVAVGTTSVRTLEYASDPDGKVIAGAGCCDLFIYPGYGFKVVDAMITNFHLPKSTLLMLVSAFAGRENVLNAYQTAIDNGYRFYSYGDAMFIA